MNYLDITKRLRRKTFININSNLKLGLGDVKKYYNHSFTLFQIDNDHIIIQLTIVHIKMQTILSEGGLCLLCLRSSDSTPCCFGFLPSRMVCRLIKDAHAYSMYANTSPHNCKYIINLSNSFCFTAASVKICKIVPLFKNSYRRF